MTKPVRRLVTALVVLVVGVLTVAVVTEPGGGTGTPSPPTYSGTYGHDELERAARMTQRMSTANADTDAQSHREDEQLSQSSDPVFVRDLEAHQADIDRMLARPRR